MPTVCRWQRSHSLRCGRVRIAYCTNIEFIDVIDGDCVSLIVNDPSAEVARTVMLRVGPSVSRLMAPATVTTPVLLLIVNRPPSLLTNE